MKFLSHLQQSQWGKICMWKNHTSRKRSQATWQPPPATIVYLLMVSCAEALVHVLHEMQHLWPRGSARSMLTSYMSTEAQGWERTSSRSQVFVSLQTVTPKVLPLQRRPKGMLSSLP